MINNIEIIKPLLSFPNEDTFYKIEVMQRRKEHPDLHSNTRLIKTYYISSLEKLEIAFKEEIKQMCDFFNARAYIYLNSRSYEKVAFAALKQIAECLVTHDYKSIKRAYNAACGKTCNGGENKKWIFDLDEKNDIICNRIKKLVESVGGTVHAVIPTKNGMHIITSVFNLQDYKEALDNEIYKYPTSHDLSVIEAIDIHKDNGTILYIP